MNNINKIEAKIQEKHEILQRYDGKLVSKGKFSGKIFNPYWRVKNKETDEIYYIMLCSENVLTYISEENINEVIQHNSSWFYNKYIGYVIAGNGNREHIYLHAFIKKHYGNGKGGDSVDHLNRKKLDNRDKNLKIKTCGENTSNTQKKKRQKNAIALPEILKIENLPKYCEYRPEFYPQTKNLKRDFFLINNHPNLEKSSAKKNCWTTTKSMSVSIIQKYNDLIEKLKKLDPYYENDMVPIKELHKEFFIDEVLINDDNSNEDDDNDSSDNDHSNDINDKQIIKKEEENKINEGLQQLLNIEKNISKNNRPNIKRKLKPLIKKEDLKDEQVEQKIEKDETANNENSNMVKKRQEISKKQIIEILRLKIKNKNKESFENGVKITRQSICDYYKENKTIDCLTVNIIDKIWNKMVLKKEDFENNELNMTYDEYIELVNSKNRNNN